MDANLIFWVYAYLLTCAALLFGILGVSKAKSGDLVGHRNRMVWACNLILFFVVSYLFKVIFLHREDKSNWELSYLIVLYIHESLILAMLISGGTARYLATQFKGEVSSGKLDPNKSKQYRLHAKAGKATLLFCSLALLTASYVLWGMFERA